MPDFTRAVLVLGSAEVRYGLFLNALVSFLLVAAAIFFFVVKPMNRLAAARKTEPDVSSPTKECPECLSSIPEGAGRCAFCTSTQPAGSVHSASAAQVELPEIAQGIVAADSAQ